MKTTEAGLSKNRILSELVKVAHGDYKLYLSLGLEAARAEPLFLAHLIAWNYSKGKVRDTKVALPVITLAEPTFPFDLVENSLAHLAILDPRNLLKAVSFAKDIKLDGRMRSVRRMVEAYLRARESDWGWFQRSILQHRQSIKRLYSMFHVEPGQGTIPGAHPGTTLADIVFPGGSKKKLRESQPPPSDSALEAVAIIKQSLLSTVEIAGLITKYRIPFLTAVGALGKNAKDPDVLLALMGVMSPTELVNQSKALNGLGVKNNPALRAAYEEGLERVAKSGKQVLKTTRAAQAATDAGDANLAAKLHAVQERQFSNLAGLEGNILILGDRSRSMQLCIVAAAVVASTLAKLVKGKVHLVYFDDSPMYIDATGMTYEELMKRVQRLTTGGATSVGCGLQYAIDQKLEVDLIAIVSDAAENTSPFFAERYLRYVKEFDKEPPVYLFRFACGINASSDVDLADSMNKAGLELQEFDLTEGAIDYNSLGNFTHLMKANRYSTVQEIMDTPLRSIEQVLAEGGRRVMALE